VQAGENKSVGKKILKGAIVFAIAFLALLIISSMAKINTWLLDILLLLRPILVGLILAYLLNPVFRFFERKLFKHLRPFGLRRAFSLFCSVLVLFLFIALLVFLIAPQLAKSISLFIKDSDQYIDAGIGKANQFLEAVNGILERLTGNPAVIGYFDGERLRAYFEKSADTWIQNMKSENYQPITSILGDTFSWIVDAVLGLFLTVYLLATKEKRYAQIMKLRRALLGDLTNERITRICTVADRSFGGFVKGKLIDSLIAAFVIYLFLLLFQVPYALLLAVFIGITNIIPMVGMLVGMVPTSVIVLLTDPDKIIPFLLVVVTVQILDNNILSPRILGSNTGVSSLCVLIALVVTGSLWGWFGMLVAVPLFATILELLDEWTVARLQKKGLPSGVESYYANDTLVEPERNVHSTVDKTAQKIERSALRAQRKLARGEQPSRGERAALRINRLAQKHHLFTEISDKSQIAVSTEEVVKAAEAEAKAYLESNAKESCADGGTENPLDSDRTV